ncbi:MAG: hypothetical protein A3G08_02875 [Candidatus Magasanikbacteria bacterium RIFCSPLOWO2_12_FULL_47_9b]|nr:MAG: hypothetical protein A3I74_02720 [Candidatus Magasanikbacteria bacterium RIFCSPLOWO2_02_FULL_47_16]OGH79713.1 MAG: hypothetical protein A3C10_00680 [Candidatus Magasanikbacteria bacterium RIFCSPHIGHO2_02_FULL_48_18]OGH82843.1 MAG: hypothetical protein A3G08_02875 [Candidatus Magasanikbacteria bacterium RIFCSPLOWO2_12_FULL_47_9b]
MTPEKKTQLEKKLKTLKTLQRPQAASEVARLAELGDFSENVEYQLAKGRLRRINNNILRLEHLLNQAVIIAPPKGNAIQIGHKVTITENGKTKIYHILGSEETNPEKGIISHRSPIGVALLGHKIGDIVEVGLPGKTILYTIVQIV